MSLRRTFLPPGGAGTLFSLADQAVVSAMGFALTVLIGRFGLPSDLGLYALAMSVAWLVVEAFTALVVCPFTLRRHDGDPQDGDALRSAALVQGILAAAAAAVMYAAVFGGIVGSGGGAPIPPGTLLAMALAVAALVFREQARRLRAAELDMAGALGLDLGVAAGLLTGAGALMAASVYSLPRMMGVVALAFALPGALWCAGQFRRHPVTLAAVLRAVVANWRAGRWIFLSGFVWAAVIYAYPWLLARQLGLAASGEWAAMMSLVAIAGVPISGLQNYGGVRVLAAARRPARLTREILGWSGLSAGVSASFAGVLWLAGDDLAGAIFGAAYRHGGPVAMLLALNLVAASASFPFARGLFALNAAQYNVVINLGALLAVLPAMLVIAEYGVAGAAGALTASSAAGLLARIAVFFLLIRRTRGGSPARSALCDAPG